MIINDVERIIKTTIVKLVAFVTVAVPILYLVGYFYHIAYLYEFGLSSDFYSLDTQEYLSLFFVVFSLSAISVFSWLQAHVHFIVMAVVVYYLLMVGVVFFVRNESHLMEKSGGIKAVIKNSWWYQYLVLPIVPTGAIFYMVLYIFVFVLSAALIPFYGYSQGKELANERLNDFKGCDLTVLSQEQKCTFVLDEGSEILKGLRVAKSDTSIAIWNGEKTIVYPLNDEVIEVRFGVMNK